MNVRVPAFALAAQIVLATGTICAAEDGNPASVAAPAPEIHTLGAEDQRVFVVDHGGTWSMHAESVVAGSLFVSWHEAGGPDVLAKVVLDYPYTLSLHRVTAERILERMLEGWSYTLHYDAGGHLERVRVYSAEPQRIFKTPRLTESLADWKKQETGEPAPAAAPANEASPPDATMQQQDPPADPSQLSE